MSIIHLEQVPASVQLDLCDLAYRKAAEYFKDPAVQIRYEKWLAERNQAASGKEHGIKKVPPPAHTAEGGRRPGHGYPKEE